MKRKLWKFGVATAMVAAMLSSGCWGLVLYGRPGPGRNQGKIDWGVVVLDIILTPWCLGVVIDACAGTLRQPGYGGCSDAGSHPDIERYKRVGYRESSDPIQLRDEFHIQLRPKDVKSAGGCKLEVVWTDSQGTSSTLYTGTVRDAAGKRLDTRKLAGRGSISVRLEGREAMAWNAERPAVAAVAAR